MSGIQQTLYNAITTPRADLVRKDFEDLIQRRGRRVVLETALLCPCKSASTNQLSTCKNCGGSGWLFINPLFTRMVITSVDAITKNGDWSETLRGTVNISCSDGTHLCFMDRITLLDGKSKHQEVLNVKIDDDGTTLFSYTAYPVKQIEYVAMFVSSSLPLRRLVEGTDFTWVGQNFKLLISATEQTTITVRYIHAPVFHVTELKRDTMQSFRLDDGVEKNQNLPLSAYGKRAHYILDQKDLNGQGIIDNNYLPPCPEDQAGSSCDCNDEGLGVYNITQNNITTQTEWQEIDW